MALSMKEYVNRFYQKKIKWKDYSYQEWMQYLWLTALYVWTLQWFVLIRADDTVELISEDHRIKIILIVEWCSALIYRDNRTEMVEDYNRFCDALFWLKR